MKQNRLLTAYLALIIAILLPACRKDDSDRRIAPGTMAIVLAGNTAMRVDPLIFSSKVYQLKKGQSIELVDRSVEKSWVGNAEDYWYKVRLKNGITGWVYGKTIKIMTGKSKDSVQRYVNSYMKTEAEKVQKSLTGKWWSINQFYDYTSHVLDITSDGTYKSYQRGQDPKYVPEGKFHIDYNKSEIVFEKGTTFGTNLEWIRRGTEYLLRKEQEEGELRFKKISIEIEKKILEEHENTQKELKELQDKINPQQPQQAADENKAQ